MIREILHKNNMNHVIEKFLMNSNTVLFNSPTQTQNISTIIPGTSYQYKNTYGKALTAICHTEIRTPIFEKKYSPTGRILFIQNRDEKKYTYMDVIKKTDSSIRISVYCEDIYSSDIYSLLFAVCNMIWKESGDSKVEKIGRNWQKISMHQHFNGENWDVNEEGYVTEIAKGLVKILAEIIEKDSNLYRIRQNDIAVFRRCISELIRGAESVTEKYIFDNSTDEEKSKDSSTQYSSDIEDISMFSEDEIERLPMEMQISIEENRKIFRRNRSFLDRNDRTVIKAFRRGKIWTAGYYGPSGTGKTTKLMTIAGALGLPTFKVSGSRNIDESYLFGKYILKNGETVFQYGPLAKAMKYGGMFIFDEINMVDSDILSSMNDLLDSTRTKTLDNGEIIRAHRNFRFAESMNIGYTGTNEMNLSHKSRIQTKVKLSRISLDTMTGIVVRETGISEDIARKMCNMIEGINHMIETSGNGDETTQRIDLRNIINWANMTIDLDGDIVEASLTTIISSLTEDDDSIENTSYEDTVNGSSLASDVMDIITGSFS